MEKLFVLIFFFFYFSTFEKFYSPLMCLDMLSRFGDTKTRSSAGITSDLGTGVTSILVLASGSLIVYVTVSLFMRQQARAA